MKEVASHEPTDSSVSADIPPRPGFRTSSRARGQITTGSPVSYFGKGASGVTPSDQSIILLYQHQTNLLITQKNPDWHAIVKRIETSLEMIRKAYGGVTCLQCGMPWAEHPSTTPGGTDHFCISVPVVKA